MNTHVLKIAYDTSITENENSDANEKLSKCWDTDTLGINGTNDPSVHDKFERDITFNGKQCVVKLPFKANREILPDTFVIAKNRLFSLTRKFNQTPGLRKEYSRVLKKYEKDGMIERIDHIPGNLTSNTCDLYSMFKQNIQLRKNSNVEQNNENSSKPNHVWQNSNVDSNNKNIDTEYTRNLHYSPHRAVLKEDRETTKLRIVFDASAKGFGEPSLNDVLYSGPCMLPYLFNILLRFRIWNIAIIADIKQAFLNVLIIDEHRDYLRFIWMADDESIEIFRINRVVFGINCIPFLLNATIRHHVEKYVLEYNNLSKQYIRDLNVDDFASGVDTFEEGVKLYEFSKS